MRTLKIDSIRLAISLSCATLAVQAVSAPLLQRELGDGTVVALEREASHPDQVVLYRTETDKQSPSILWSHSFPIVGPPGTPSFDAFDLYPARGGVFVCYKADRATFDAFSSFAGQSLSSAPTELTRDRYGAMVTTAKFSTTNGQTLLMLGIKNRGGKAWGYADGNWSRAEQRDLTVPLWARQIDLSDKRLGTREFFPLDYYTNVNWGPVKNDSQLGLRLQQQEYHPGEKIVALLHIRNQSEHPLKVKISTLASENGPIDLSILDSKNEPIASKFSELAQFIEPLTRTLDAKTQEVCAIDLEQYKLAPGVYTVRAALRLPEQERSKEQSTIASGEASFRVTGAEN